jgi:hypothetical protein
MVLLDGFYVIMSGFVRVFINNTDFLSESGFAGLLDGQDSLFMNGL